jgi:hypothetical protein
MASSFPNEHRRLDGATPSVVKSLVLYDINGTKLWPPEERLFNLGRSLRRDDDARAAPDAARLHGRPVEGCRDQDRDGARRAGTDGLITTNA